MKVETQYCMLQHLLTNHKFFIPFDFPFILSIDLCFFRWSATVGDRDGRGGQRQKGPEMVENERHEGLFGDLVVNLIVLLEF